MSCENCCNCVYGEYKPRDEHHLGTEKGKPDLWCNYYDKWVGTYGKCSEYRPD